MLHDDIQLLLNFGEGHRSSGAIEPRIFVTWRSPINAADGAQESIGTGRAWTKWGLPISRSLLIRKDIMDQLDELRAAASLLLKKAQDASVSDLGSAIEKVSGVLKLSSELETSQTETRKLALEERKLQNENEADRRKDYLALLTPIAAILTLAATLITQTYQNRQTEKDRRDAALEARWQDTVKDISKIINLPAGIGTLRPFLDSPKYGDQARDLVVELLANSSNQGLFTEFFEAFIPVRWNNLDYVAKLDRAIKTKSIPVLL